MSIRVSIAVLTLSLAAPAFAAGEGGGKTLVRTKSARKIPAKPAAVDAWLKSGLEALKARLTPTKRSEFQKVIADTKTGGRTAFRSFCISEYSGENFNSLAAMDDYRRAPSLTKLDNLLKTYFSVGATEEVNAPKSLFEKLKSAKVAAALKDAKLNVSARGKTITAEVRSVLDELRTAIFANLADTWSRFIFSSGYEAWKKKQTVGAKIVDRVRTLDHHTLQVEKNVHDAKQLGKDIVQGGKKLLKKTKKKPQ